MGIGATQKASGNRPAGIEQLSATSRWSLKVSALCRISVDRHARERLHPGSGLTIPKETSTLGRGRAPGSHSQTKPSGRVTSLQEATMETAILRKLSVKSNYTCCGTKCRGSSDEWKTRDTKNGEQNLAFPLDSPTPTIFPFPPRHSLAHRSVNHSRFAHLIGANPSLLGEKLREIARDLIAARRGHAGDIRFVGLHA